MKTVKKARKTLDDLGKYPFGTGFDSTSAFETSSNYLMGQAANGVGEILNQHRGTADGNMFNVPEEGQILAMGGPVDGGNGNAGLIAGNMVGNAFHIPSLESTYNPSLLTDGKFLVTKSDGSLGQWGNPVPPIAPIAPNSVGVPQPQPSDKTLGFSNNYYPSKGQMKGKSPAEIESPTGKYAMGGKVEIKPSHRGMFTKWAKDHQMTVSEAASHVMANKGKYSKHVEKMANFAKNFAAMGDSSLQPLNDPQQQMQSNPNVPVEVEGGEVAQLPNGQMGQFQGPTHENGGIPANLPQGTKIYSDRLAVDGKSMQARKLSREKRIGKLNNMLDKDPTDTINRNTYNRSKAAADMEEQQDLMMQDAANQIYQKVPQLQDASSGFQTPMENQQEQYQQQGDMGQVQGAGVPRFAGGTGASGIDDPTDPDAWNSWITNVQKPFSPSAMSYTTAPDYTTGATTADEDTKKSTDMPYSSGDKLGFLGNATNAITPLLTTMANRAGDKSNVNAFQNFGQNAIDANDRGMGFMSVVRDEALKNTNTIATTQRTRNRNSSSSVNVSRALDLATSASQDTSNNSIYSNYASQMAGMYNERSKLSNQQDLYKDTGAQTADKMDRMDRDSYYTNLSQNLANVGKQAQSTGKEMNEHDYNNQVLAIMPYLNKYGLGFTYDENGHISGMTKIAG